MKSLDQGQRRGCVAAQDSGLCQTHDGAAALSDRPGTYLILLEPRVAGPVPIGRLGTLTLDGGVLLYIGSALGPGGVEARCRHHLRIADRPRWHLDYLRPHCDVIGIWAGCGPRRCEHRWARALAALSDASIPLARFGASDCRCAAHLIRLPCLPAVPLFAATLGRGQFHRSVDLTPCLRGRAAARH